MRERTGYTCTYCSLQEGEHLENRVDELDREKVYFEKMYFILRNQEDL